MSKQYKTVLVLVFGIFVGVSVSLTSSVLAEKKAETTAAGLPLNELRNFSDIFARVKTDYVEDVDDKTLLENAIRGMLSGLDPHSTYLNSDEYKELQKATIKKFEWEFEDEEGVGRVDLWYEINGVCKIVDFKTGQPKEEHKTQIERYKKALQTKGYKNITTKLLYLGEKK